MYTYITTGTFFFLKKMKDKHPEDRMLLMQNADTCQLWHETEGKTIFQSPRKYEVIHSSGQLEQKGHVACDHISIREESRPVFEYTFSDHMKKVDSLPGFTAFRLLRPLSSDTYIAMTIWEDEESLRSWQQSALFADSHSTVIQAAKSTNGFSGPSYLAVFVLDNEDEKNTD
ncbi:antibiotic biosynthesis monooxygenase family protein [Bacillus norwichensis]|uniref:Antibiotic biosynthesis monooxygenase n=1 Tax=Bacillus norwichensis TaxID=2762217 RepID=A0ABR8VG87_9BACI|nr:antibiotic biosynthesis monooxygenase [Bacillus norwichensis]MBD8003797.1 antibiotic biosynthesis monooxygenase [Bacillus norwichensis]